MSTNLFGMAEPVWLTCGCGAVSARVPCWDCSRGEREAQEHREQRDLAEGTYPARFRWARLDAPDLPKRVGWRGDLGTLAKRVLGAGTVVFVGPAGAGKTSLAVACLRERRPAGIVVPSWRLGTARIQTPAGQGEAKLVEQAIAAPLALIDDVGSEAKTATNAVRDVVFARHDADLPTWITTGLSAAELSTLYGDGFVRRLTEGALIVRLGSELRDGG